MTLPRVYKVEGIILKRKNVGEADRIITIFTKEYGKMRVIAKGIRKIASRRAPHLEVFTRANILIHSGKTFETVSEVEPIDVYEDTRRDLPRVSMAYYLCELVDGLLPEKQEHRDVFVLFTKALDDLGRGKISRIYGMCKSFTLELLWTLGFLPRPNILHGKELQSFIETITERKLKSTHFARLLISKM